MVISKKTIIFQGFRGGVQLVSGGGGVQMLYISKETHKIGDFPGGSEATTPSLDPRMYPMALNFGLGPQQLEKKPLDPLAATCIYLPFMLNFKFCQF